jgi:hypothetical protein
MKKVLLLSTICLCAIAGANAQYARQSIVNTDNSKKIPFADVNSGHGIAVPKRSVIDNIGARTTTTVIPGTTDDFGSTTSYAVLPTGWSAGILSGPGTWHWANMVSHAPFQIGTINSPSASNGWMIFDSDSLGGAVSTGPSPCGWLQSPPYNCSGHPNVRVNFSNYFRKFKDSCYIWASTTPSFAAGTYTVFPVFLNNGLPNNTTLPNPTTAHVNISSVAGGQPTVYIRFVYLGSAGGGYQWMIDDVNLSDMDAVDVALDKPFVAYYGGLDVGWNAFGSKPAKMIDTLAPEVYATNWGYTAEPTTTVTANIFQGSSPVYTNTIVRNLPVDAIDSLVDFVPAGRFYSNVVASYLVPFSTSLSGDADVNNNSDTIRYAVTDTTWSQNVPGLAPLGRVFVHRLATATTPEASFSIATQFDVTAGRMDTVTSASVAFHHTTIAGQSAGVQFYHFNTTTSAWVYDGETIFKTLASSDISTSTSVVYTNFPVDLNEGSIILDGGDRGRHYAAVVKGLNNNDTVTLVLGDNPGPYSIIGFVGAYDTSDNDGSASQQFGVGGLPNGYPSTPYINLNFGPTPPVSIIDLNTNNNKVGIAYPNPANTVINIPFTMAENTTVRVVVTNAVGQMVSTRDFDATAGQASKASIETGGFSPGMYLYTVSANGIRTTGRIMVAH